MCGVFGEKGHSRKTCLYDYKKLVRVSDKNHECSICLSKVNKPICKTECGHYFHITCIKEWLSKNNTCPLCREKIGDVSPSNVLMILIESLMENIDSNILLTENLVELYFENEILI